MFSGLLGALVSEAGVRGGAEAGSGQKAVIGRQVVHSFLSTRGAFDLQRAELGPAWNADSESHWPDHTEHVGGALSPPPKATDQAGAE